MTAKLDTRTAPQSHSTLFADVALIDAKQCAAIGSMSESWWYEQVKKGCAPKAAISMVRCTRWRASDVRSFWVKFAQAADPAAGERVAAQAAKASAQAKANRAGAAAS